jgi:hypothetical protein
MSSRTWAVLYDTIAFRVCDLRFNLGQTCVHLVTSLASSGFYLVNQADARVSGCRGGPASLRRAAMADEEAPLPPVEIPWKLAATT